VGDSTCLSSRTWCWINWTRAGVLVIRHGEGPILSNNLSAEERLGVLAN